MQYLIARVLDPYLSANFRPKLVAVARLTKNKARLASANFRPKQLNSRHAEVVAAGGLVTPSVWTQSRQHSRG
eukprot:scaffold134575_cov63-Phaeocystis_antarctica.AAC.1